MHVGHDVVTAFGFLDGDGGEFRVGDGEGGAHLGEGEVRDGQAEGLFRLSEPEPEVPPGAESGAGGPECFHFGAAVAGVEGGLVLIIIWGRRGGGGRGRCGHGDRFLFCLIAFSENERSIYFKGMRRLLNQLRMWGKEMENLVSYRRTISDRLTILWLVRKISEHLSTQIIILLIVNEHVRKTNSHNAAGIL